MSEWDRILIFIAAVTSAAVCLAMIIILAADRPPHFCKYFVPVKTYPNIYTCSSKPKPR